MTSGKIVIMKKRGGRSRGKSKRGVYGPPDDLPDLHPDSDSESEAEDEECDWFEEEEQKQSKTLEECDHSDDDPEVAPDLSLPFSNQDETAQVKTVIIPENKEDIVKIQPIRQSKRVTKAPSHLDAYHVPVLDSHRYSDADVLQISQSSSQGRTPQATVSGDWADVREEIEDQWEEEIREWNTPKHLRCSNKDHRDDGCQDSLG